MINLKEEYINFFEEKGHTLLKSASLIPKDDPTVLFNTAGMQPLVPYLLGKKHPSGSKRLLSCQKCVRLTDLDEIGDTTHHTFFEMLGNWSLGDYFKEESISYSFEFLTKNLNIPIEKIGVTVFKGNEIATKDEESALIWISKGIDKNKIAYLKEDNWWPNMENIGPCGPDTEIFYFNSDDKVPEKFDPADERWVEIWNNVFMQYYHNEDGTYSELKNKNVDTGMGYERVTAILEGYKDNYLSSAWINTINLIEKISNKSYKNNEVNMRIVADHIRTSVFIAADDFKVTPSNVGRGYILRRLIRRAIRYARKLDIDINTNWEELIAKNIIEKYKDQYIELETNEKQVLEILKNEKEKFNKTLNKGLKEFNKLIDSNIKGINKDQAFKLFDTYGFPIELTCELAKENNIEVDIEGFKEKFKNHQEISKAGSKAKFKSGLAGNSDIEIKYHTATHLLNAALKEVLGKDTHQRGSNITPDRLRFDFNCDHKITEEEKQNIEDLINQWITMDIKITEEEMTKEEAIKTGAEAMFIDKYGDIVKVYSIGDISKEICGGPHVKSTKELGYFKIKKEESSSSGIRRIKAILK